ncbi:hypothetical protein SDC9_193974 [bioreactor metagenome]|uniref:Uncharacterized protein n=1 Tax=bioreactor metagenome TaxID=1076179 RepID=A0A645I559_9ZZZZ
MRRLTYIEMSRIVVNCHLVQLVITLFGYDENVVANIGDSFRVSSSLDRYLAQQHAIGAEFGHCRRSIDDRK